MKQLFCTLRAALSIVLTASAAAPTTPATTADAKALEGDWNPVKGELGGKPMAEQVLKAITLHMEKGNYEVFAGGAPDRGTYSIDATTKPKSMTVVGTLGPNQGKTFPAIYELNGDSLRICYDLSGAKRPTEFKTVVGTKLYLVTYQRKKE